MNSRQKAILRSLVEELIMEAHPELLDDDLSDAFEDYDNQMDAHETIITYLENKLI